MIDQYNTALKERKKRERQRRKELGTDKSRDDYYKKMDRLNIEKSKPCMDCEKTFPPECMDFDHRPGEQKLFGIGMGRTRAWENLQREIAKCDLVCANCHRVRTTARKRKNSGRK